MDREVRFLPDWLDVSRETLARLGHFLDLVEKWNPRINLVSAASLSRGWSRHVLDSAQLWGLARPTACTWLDLGSGGGFPGIVVSIVAGELSPGLRVTLVESDRRKSVFLSEAIRQLDLSAQVLCDRIENLPPMRADVVSARALATLDVLLPMVSRHVAAGGLALFLKGQRYQEELQSCQKDWAMRSDVTPSQTDPDGAIIKIWDLHHV